LATIEWTEDALKDIEKLDKLVARRILRKISWFGDNFERVIPEPLSGDFKGTFKLRIGDWRVIYTLEGNVIVIQMIGHRREIYKGF
jgi:mRNA interferase RelE/StbE